jgi:hypothetical protein
VSSQAEQHVKACTHPKVKGGARALLEAIARSIPEGQTATPSVTLDELAAGYSVKTASRARELLEAERVIKVHDGGQGKVARYEILGLTGERPIMAAPLPLVGRAKPPEAKKPRITSDILSDVLPFTSDILSEVPRTFCPKWLVYFGHFVRSWWNAALRLADVSRARAVRNTKYNTHTQIAPPAASPPTKWPRCPQTGTVHAWCDGLVHVPMQLHRDFVRKHGRAVGQTDADIEAELFAFYTRRSAGLNPRDKIRENDFQFWRRCRNEEWPPVSSAAPTRSRASPRGEIPYDLYERGIEDERRRRGGS